MQQNLQRSVTKRYPFTIEGYLINTFLACFVKLKAPGESFQTDFHLQKGWLSQIDKTTMCRPKVKWEFLLNYMKRASTFYIVQQSFFAHQLHSWFIVNSVTCTLDSKARNIDISIALFEVFWICVISGFFMNNIFCDFTFGSITCRQ